jgi:hypothetical protein
MAAAALPIIASTADGDLSLPADVDFQAFDSLSRIYLQNNGGLTLAPKELALEPVGPHFLAHARRKRHNRTFSEDEKHQAEVSALSLEDKSGNVSEDDEPEDPAMLERDPKEWKVSYLIIAYNRNKTTMLSLDYQSTATKQPRIKSKGLTERRH